MPHGPETTDRRQFSIFASVALGLGLVFGLFIVPLLSPAPSTGLNEPAPDFSLEVIVGGEPGSRIRLSDLKGRTVLLDFWASWCAPCRAQAPIIDAINRAYPSDRFAIVGVNTGDDPERAKQFALQSRLSYPSVYDAGEVFKGYGASGLPTLAVVDRQGILVALESGVMRRGQIEALLQTASR
jgi:thiol-disulfide isomerase/thioredoxin